MNRIEPLSLHSLKNCKLANSQIQIAETMSLQLFWNCRFANFWIAKIVSSQASPGKTIDILINFWIRFAEIVSLQALEKFSFFSKTKNWWTSQRKLIACKLMKNPHILKTVNWYTFQYELLLEIDHLFKSCKVANFPKRIARIAKL